MKILSNILFVGALVFFRAAYSSELSPNEQTDKVLRLFSKLGETTFNSCGADLITLAKDNILSVALQRKIEAIPSQYRSKEELETLAQYHQHNFSEGARSALSTYNYLQQQFELDRSPGPSSPPLTSDERIFSHLGIGLVYRLAEEGELDVFRKSLHDLYKRGKDRFTLMSFSQNGMEKLPCQQNQEEGSRTPLDERTFIQKVSALSYVGLRHTPLCKSLRFWDVAKAAGQWSYLYYGPQSYKQYERILFHEPMETRFKEMIRGASHLKDTIQYPERSMRGAQYALFPNNVERFKEFFMEEFSSYLNARLMGKFTLTPLNERSLDEGIEIARATKKSTYKILTSLIAQLYPGNSFEENMSALKLIMDFGWSLKQMSTLFDQDQPFWENDLWSECILGWEKVNSMRTNLS